MSTKEKINLTDKKVVFDIVGKDNAIIGIESIVRHQFNYADNFSIIRIGIDDYLSDIRILKPMKVNQDDYFDSLLIRDLEIEGIEVQDQVSEYKMRNDSTFLGVIEVLVKVIDTNTVSLILIAGDQPSYQFIHQMVNS